MKPKILIVDDTPENIDVLFHTLCKDYALITATNGQSALEKANKTPHPDLILLDVMMPGLSGFEVCEKLKQNPNTKEIPVIFISAATAPDNELQGLRTGAVDYIHKPFSIPLVRARVANHLELAQSRQTLIEKNHALEKNAKLREDIERITRHDLKTPLNAVLGYPQLMLLDDNLSEEQREQLDEVLRAANDMLNMINSSLDMYKMETGCYNYQPDKIDILVIIKTVIKDLASLTKSANITFNLDTENQNFIIYAEKSLCYSLFANLIRNAIEASPKNEVINISFVYEERFAMIKICNKGAVPENIRADFFKKYATYGKSSGTGLGTYSAKLITETQGGKIEMFSERNETCITVKLCKD